MTSTPEFNIGQALGGRYRIKSYLGGGGFGRTYLAEDLHLPDSPLCVVKHLKPQLSDAISVATAERLFETEARVLYRLGDHDRIPRLFAHFEENQEFYLVQEHIEGKNLREEFMPGQRWTEADVLDLMRDILEVLMFVHGQNVIHRDIKPSNLIRRERDRKVVLVDFGAVKQLGTRIIGAQGQTTRTISIGSPGYMPNEQLAGRPRFCSDLYAIGMIGLQALTGVHPKELPEDPHTYEILWRDRLQHESPLCDVLDRLVRYDFRDRYATAAEVLAELEKLSPRMLQRPTSGVNAAVGSADLFAPTTVSPVLLDSERGIDYRSLQDLLKREAWLEADQETRNLMLKLSDRPPGVRLNTNDIRQLPCRDLRTLDYLWVTYSHGRFGFSVQKRIWKDVGGRSDLNYEGLELLGRAPRSGWRVNGPIERFGDRVGWRTRKVWFAYPELVFDLEAPEGHLPAWHWGAVGEGRIVTFFARLEDCLL